MTLPEHLFEDISDPADTFRKLKRSSVEDLSDKIHNSGYIGVSNNGDEYLYHLVRTFSKAYQMTGKDWELVSDPLPIGEVSEKWLHPYHPSLTHFSKKEFEEFLEAEGYLPYEFFELETVWIG